MNLENQERVDEVLHYYSYPEKCEFVGTILFLVNALLSCSLLFLEMFSALWQSIVPSLFAFFVLSQFIASQVNRFSLIPKAEKMRRKQMLSNAFGTPLSHDKTSQYYNNDYAPSIKRLGANTMENALFSYEVAKEMLVTKRIFIGLYFVIWILIFSFRHINLDVFIWITQVVFSGEIIVHWVSLEFLRYRQESTFEKLYSFFLHEIGDKSHKEVATILDLFASYEVAKSTSYILSRKVFTKLNPKITKKWEKIRSELKMNT